MSVLGSRRAWRCGLLELLEGVVISTADVVLGITAAGLARMLVSKAVRTALVYKDRAEPLQSREPEEPLAFP